MKRLHLITVIAGGAMMLTACSNDNLWDYDKVPAEGAEDYVDVTFRVASESLPVLSRATEEETPGGPGQWQTISRGKEIDMLVYAVYDENLTPMTQYGEGLKAADGEAVFVNGTTPALSLTDGDGNLYAHKGQTIVNVGEIFANGDSYTVTLRLMRKKQYTVAFWAQSSQSTAYITDNLHQVEVRYQDEKGKDFVNNDERRDAFCKTETFTVTEGGVNQEVILTRPFAQLNVGTTGADYKQIEIGTTVASTHKKFAYSKVKIEGVAKYLDVVKGKVLSQNDIEDYLALPDVDNSGEGKDKANSPYTFKIGDKATTNVTFDWAKIPAYYAVSSIPAQNLYNKTAGEELLTIDLNQDGNILGYKTSYPTLGSKGSFMTEEFKYMSMSYILVASPKADDSNNDGIVNSKVIDKVTVWFAESSDGSDGMLMMEVPLVPARTNWRTNLIGGLKWMKDPTDGTPTNPDDPNNPYDDPDYPDNPDDPNNPYDPEDPENPSHIPDGPDNTTIFHSVYARPVIVSDFFGEKKTDVIEGLEIEKAQ